MPAESCTRGRPATRSSSRPVRHSSRCSIAARAGSRLFDDVPHDSLQIACLPEYRQLTIGAGPLSQHGVDIFDRLAALELVDHVVYELEQLQRQVSHRDFGSLAEVN